METDGKEKERTSNTGQWRPLYPQESSSCLQMVPAGWPLPRNPTTPGSQEWPSGTELSVGNRNQRKPPAEAAPLSYPTLEGFNHNPRTPQGRLQLYKKTYKSIAGPKPDCKDLQRNPGEIPSVRNFLHVRRAFYKLFHST